MTQPEPEERLVEFYRRVRPSGIGWRRVARIAGPVTSEPLGVGVLEWFAGCGLVYGALFGIGKVVLGSTLEGLLYLVLAAGCFAIIWINVNRRAAPEPVALAAEEPAT